MVLTITPLTTAEKVSRVSGISNTGDNGLLLNTLIPQITAEMETYCGYHFSQNTYVEIQNTTQNQKRIRLKNRPLLTVDSVRYGYVFCIQIQYTGSSISASAQITSAEPLNGTQYCILTTPDATTKLNLSDGTIKTTSQLVTAINAVTGFNATLQGNFNVPTKWLWPTTFNLLTGGSHYAQYFAYPYIDLIPIAVDYDNATLSFQPLGTQDYFFPGSANASYITGFPKMYQGVMIEYQAGYTTFPLDLELKCQKYVIQAYYQLKNNPTLKSETLKDYSYTQEVGKTLQDQFIVDLAAYRGIPFCGGGR